jgi:hypothetical protein
VRFEQQQRELEFGERQLGADRGCHDRSWFDVADDGERRAGFGWNGLFHGGLGRPAELHLSDVYVRGL